MASVLHARIAFTKLVDAAFAGANIGLPVEVGLAGIRTVIEKKQASAITRSRETIPKLLRKQISSLLILYQEQLSVLDDITNAKTPSEAWAAEARFETHADGSLKCKIGEQVELMDDDFPSKSMLVVTALSREARRAYFKALQCGNTLFFVGPPGTGKTETAKDITSMLGREATVLDENGTSLTADKVIAALAKVPKNIRVPVILDEFNRIPTEEQKAILQRIEKERPGQFVILTANSGHPHRHPVEVPKLQTLKFTRPKLDMILEAMFATHGFLKFKALAKLLLALNTDCQTRCSNQSFYDYGLRSLKSIVRFANAIAVSNGYTDEVGALMQAVASKFYCRAVKNDKAVVVDAVQRGGFGKAWTVPDEFTGALGLAQQAVATSRVRHGVCINGVTDPQSMIKMVSTVATSGSPATKFVTIEVDPKAGLDSSEGPLYSAMTSSIGSSDSVVVFLVMPGAGAPVNDILKPLYPLFDDNKRVVFDNGQVVHMAPNMRFFVITADCSDFCPALISRLGVVTVV